MSKSNTKIPNEHGFAAEGKTELAEKERRPNYLVQAWLVLLLSVLYGALLVTVQMGLSEKIKANQKQATYAQIPTLVEGADASKTKEIRILGTNGKKIRVYQVFDASEKHIGWVFPGIGQGFADAISVIIGLDAQAETLTGLYVLDQKETPGLGNFITDEPFRSQFAGKSCLTPVSAIAGKPVNPQQVQAVTGATISSKAVCDIVNASVSCCREAALEAAKAPQTPTDGSVPK